MVENVFGEKYLPLGEGETRTIHGVKRGGQ